MSASNRVLQALQAIAADGGSCPRGELRDYVPGRGPLLPVVKEGLSLGLLQARHDDWAITDAGRAAIAHMEGKMK